MEDEEHRRMTEFLNDRNAVRWHDRHDQGGHDMFRAAIDFGLEAIRTAALLNGGAVVACFAFLGVLLGSSNPQAAALFKPLLWPASVFTLGAVLAGSASGWAYFAQGYFAEAHNWVTYTYQPEDKYIVNQPERSTYDGKGKLFQILSIACVVGSYLCTIVGIIWGGMILRP
jgi:hypothetical protein